MLDWSCTPTPAAVPASDAAPAARAPRAAPAARARPAAAAVAARMAEVSVLSAAAAGRGCFRVPVAAMEATAVARGPEAAATHELWCRGPACLSECTRRAGVWACSLPPSLPSSLPPSLYLSLARAFAAVCTSTQAGRHFDELVQTVLNGECASKDTHSQLIIRFSL